MMRKNMCVRVVALTTVVLGSLLAGCHSGPPADVTKEPNKDVHAGPPNATPGELAEIQKHMKSGH